MNWTCHITYLVLIRVATVRNVPSSAKLCYLVPAPPDVNEAGDPQSNAKEPGHRASQVVDGLNNTPVSKLGPATATTQGKLDL